MNASIDKTDLNGFSRLEVKSSSRQLIELCLEHDKMVESLASCLTKHGKLFVVHGKISYQSCGAKALIDHVIVRCCYTLVEFDDFSENPKKKDVDRGVALFNQNYCYRRRKCYGYGKTD